MYYGYTTLATDWNKEEMSSLSIRLISAIFFFIPRANPDNEKLYPKVTKWLIELNEEKVPTREIAFDKENNILFYAPDKRNYGLWTDTTNDLKYQILMK